VHTLIFELLFSLLCAILCVFYTLLCTPVQHVTVMLRVGVIKDDNDDDKLTYWQARIVSDDR